MYFGQIPPAVVRERLGVDEEYAVDAMLGFGVFDRNAESVVSALVGHAHDEGIEVRTRAIEPPMFSHAVELLVDGGPEQRRLWLVPVMGGAVMAYYAHMACLLGARALALAGSAGGLARGMNVGDLVVPPIVTGNDSTALYSRHAPGDAHVGPYGPQVVPEPRMASDLTARLAVLLPGTRLWKTETVTCEMFGAETADDVARWSAAGFGAVEMEAAIVCAVAAAFDVPAAAAVYVADCLITGETVYQAGYADSRAVRHASRRAVIGAAFDTLLSVCRVPLKAEGEEGSRF